MAILVKPIQPKKFKDTAFVSEFEKAAERTAKEMQRAFGKTTKTWKRKVKFERIVQVGPRSVEILVGTDDEIYRYVNDGTKPHWIFPKKPGGVLAFQSNYSAKTYPKIIDSGNGGSSGPMVFSKGVYHPGTAARDFDEVIQDDFEPIFKKRMERALSTANKKSNHAYQK